jgi:LPXTG-motif cell wall-anchored protein
MPARKHLPRTGSDLPLLVLISGLSLAGAFGLRVARATR